MLKLEGVNLSVAGLGCVGLPLAVEFGKKVNEIGFYFGKTAVGALKTYHGFTCEVPGSVLRSEFHRVKGIKKVSSGLTRKTAGLVDLLYGSVIKAGTHKTKGINVTEAVEAIDDALRDLNIGGLASAGCAIITMFRNIISFDFRFRKTTPFYSKNIGDVLTESLSTPVLLTKLSTVAVCRLEDLIGEAPQKKLGPSYSRWPNAQKKVLAR